MAELNLGTRDWGFPYESPHIEFEIYRLIASVGASPVFSQNLTDKNHGEMWAYLKKAELAEISRILLSVAAILRNSLDSWFWKENTDPPVGILVRNLDEPDRISELTFRIACNKVLHAYKVHPDVENPKLGLRSALNPLIHLYGDHRNKHWRATIDLYKFAIEAVSVC